MLVIIDYFFSILSLSGILSWCLAMITAKLGRALAVVKMTLQVIGNRQFLGVRPLKTIGTIMLKSGTNDYIVERNPHAKFGNIPITGGFFSYR